MDKKSLIGTTLAGIALTGTMLSGAVAQATPSETKNPAPTVEHKEISPQEQKSAADYWTPERMKNAESATPPASLAPSKDYGPLSTPVDTGTPDGPRVDIPGTNAQPVLQPAAQRSGKAPRTTANPGATSERPVRHIGRIFFTGWDKEKKRFAPGTCSANAVISKNKSTISTAAHCVHSGGADGHFSSNVVFVPAYENGKAPYGKWTAKNFITNSGWTEKHSRTEDTAFVILDQHKKRNLTDVVGASGVAFNTPRGQLYKSFGYPGAKPFNGKTLKSCLGTSSPDLARKGATQGIKPCYMNNGASGGPWFLNGDVSGPQNGVNSYFYTSRQGDILNGMYSPYWDSSIQELYQRASTER